MSFHKKCFEQRPKDFARSEEYARFYIATQRLLEEFDHIDDNVIVISFLREAYKYSMTANWNTKVLASKIRVAIVHFYKAQGYTDKDINKILKEDK